jgi:hypothetical protein
MNIFEERVFDDTTYTVCSFQFIYRKCSLPMNEREHTMKIDIYPNRQQIEINLNEKNDYLIGGDIYYLPTSNKYSISRLTTKNKTKPHTNIFVKCIDDNKENQISCSMVSNENIYIDTTPNLSARSFATLVIEPVISIEKQTWLVDRFNQILTEHRKKYNSLFLTNFRESKDIARKRISFELLYRIISHILLELDGV